MRFRNVEVTGITSIVFDRKVIWNLDKGTSVWYATTERFMYHSDMMKIVNLLKRDNRYRMWVHADTLNIVRKSERGCPKFVPKTLAQRMSEPSELVGALLK
jgi:hypothetical protein